MPKSISVSQVAAMQSGHHVECLFVEVDLPTGIQRYTTAGASMTWNGQTWIGGADPSWLEPIRETESQEMVGLKITLAGVSSSQRAIALGQQIQGRRITIWVAPMSASTYTLIDTPIVEWEGLLDVMYVEDRETASGLEQVLVIEAETEDARFLRANVRRYTDRDHQQRFPGDTICRFTAQSEKTIVWPAAAFSRK